MSSNITFKDSESSQKITRNGTGTVANIYKSTTEKTYELSSNKSNNISSYSSESPKKMSSNVLINDRNNSESTVSGSLKLSTTASAKDRLITTISAKGGLLTTTSSKDRLITTTLAKDGLLTTTSAKDRLITTMKLTPKPSYISTGTDDSTTSKNLPTTEQQDRSTVPLQPGAAVTPGMASTSQSTVPAAETMPDLPAHVAAQPADVLPNVTSPVPSLTATTLVGDDLTTKGDLTTQSVSVTSTTLLRTGGVNYSTISSVRTEPTGKESEGNKFHFSFFQHSV